MNLGRARPAIINVIPVPVVNAIAINEGKILAIEIVNLTLLMQPCIRCPGFVVQSFHGSSLFARDKGRYRQQPDTTASKLSQAPSLTTEIPRTIRRGSITTIWRYSKRSLVRSEAVR